MQNERWVAMAAQVAGRKLRHRQARGSEQCLEAVRVAANDGSRLEDRS